MKKPFRLLPAIFAFLVLILPGAASAQNGMRSVILTWDSDTKTTAVVSLRVYKKVDKVIVHCTRQDVQDAKAFVKGASVTEVADSGVAGIDPLCVYSARLEGLVPGAAYKCEITGTDLKEQCSFTTAPDKPALFKFLVFGDSQSGAEDKPDYSEWNKTVESAVKAVPDAGFFIQLGDLVETGASKPHWDNWFAACPALTSRYFIVPVVGNHEQILTGKKACAPDFFVKQFKVAANGPADLLGRVYSFDYSNVHFSILDSQYDQEPASERKIFSEEAAWLDRDLSASNAKWKIVLFHKPPYNTKKGRTNENVKLAFTPVIERNGVDLVLNGHDHSYARSFPVMDGRPVPEGKGTVYVITGRSGAKYYKDNDNEGNYEVFYNPSDMPMYLSCSVEPGRITLKAVKVDGTRIDSFSLSK